MQYRQLGNTGVSVSVLGFGASTLGDVYGRVTQAEADHTLAYAIDRGINLIDVSPYYGLTLAEERLGVALNGLRPNVFLATKCGRYGASDFDFSAATITREFDNSLRRLQTDHVDLLQAHDIEFGDITQIVEETIPAMRAIQAAGKARFIGITGYWPGLLARVAALQPVDTVLNYCHANLMVDDMHTALDGVAAEQGIGLLNASPLHMGLLGGGPVPDWHPAPAAARKAAAEVVALCRRHGVEPATLALSVCLQDEDVASTFVGLSSPAEVDAALSAVRYVQPEDLLREVHALIAPVHNLLWPSGRPENYDPAFAHGPAAA